MEKLCLGGSRGFGRIGLWLGSLRNSPSEPIDRFEQYMKCFGLNKRNLQWFQLDFATAHSMLLLSRPGNKQAAIKGKWLS